MTILPLPARVTRYIELLRANPKMLRSDAFKAVQAERREKAK